VARMWEVWNASKILILKPEGKTSRSERIIVEWFLGKLWTGFIWLRTVFNGRIFCIR
jgi:hypothetical protein